ncbi:MAG TPA: transaldolase, partial [Planctomycetota bacterium]|nr:transaldolase [Planctomycetota bacterium]
MPATKAQTKSASKNPLAALGALGQSVWIDHIQKSMLDSGELARLVEQDGLKGVTSNPSIFEKAITGSDDYAEQLSALRELSATDPERVSLKLAVADIQRAADTLARVYRSSRRVDGYVSLEVSPKLAHDAKATFQEALRLWKAVKRPNLMVKVPGTPEGIVAVRKLIGEGVNVNVTLLFSIGAYLEAARAYSDGLEILAKKKGDLSRVASVASFFVSRIDSAVDARLERVIADPSHAELRELARSMRGRAAIANAKLAYAEFQELVASKAWHKLAKKGARPQRLLWASTSTKNPAYRDVVYVEELVGV